MGVRKVSRDTKTEPAPKGKRAKAPRDITDEVVDEEQADGDVITDEELSVLPAAPKARGGRRKREEAAPSKGSKAVLSYKAMQSFRIDEHVVKAGELVKLSKEQAQPYLDVRAIELVRAA
jgi:hypothetical protein